MPAGQAVEMVLVVEDPDAEDGWTPPCPPEGDGPHRCIFALYALHEASGLGAGAEPEAVLEKLAGAVARGTYTGTYEREG